MNDTKLETGLLEATGQYTELAKRAGRKFADKYVGRGFVHANNAYMAQGQSREEVEETWRGILKPSKTFQVRFSWDKCIPDGLYRPEDVDTDGAFKPLSGRNLAQRIGKADACSIFTRRVSQKVRKIA